MTKKLCLIFILFLLGFAQVQAAFSLIHVSHCESHSCPDDNTSQESSAQDGHHCDECRTHFKAFSLVSKLEFVVISRDFPRPFFHKYQNPDPNSPEIPPVI